MRACGATPAGPTLERETGFEPAILGLGSRCCASQLLPRRPLSYYFPSRKDMSKALISSSLRAFQLSRLEAP